MTLYTNWIFFIFTTKSTPSFEFRVAQSTKKTDSTTRHYRTAPGRKYYRFFSAYRCSVDKRSKRTRQISRQISIPLFSSFYCTLTRRRFVRCARSKAFGLRNEFHCRQHDSFIELCIRRRPMKARTIMYSHETITHILQAAAVVCNSMRTKAVKNGFEMPLFLFVGIGSWAFIKARLYRYKLRQYKPPFSLSLSIHAILSKSFHTVCDEICAIIVLLTLFLCCFLFYAPP